MIIKVKCSPAWRSKADKVLHEKDDKCSDCVWSVIGMASVKLILHAEVFHKRHGEKGVEESEAPFYSDVDSQGTVNSSWFY